MSNSTNGELLIFFSLPENKGETQKDTSVGGPADFPSQAGENRQPFIPRRRRTHDHYHAAFHTAVALVGRCSCTCWPKTGKHTQRHTKNRCVHAHNHPAGCFKRLDSYLQSFWFFPSEHPSDRPPTATYPIPSYKYLSRASSMDQLSCWAELLYPKATQTKKEALLNPITCHVYLCNCYSIFRYFYCFINISATVRYE